MATYRGVRAKGNTIQIRWQVNGIEYSETIHERPTPTAQTNAARYRDRCIELTRRGEYDLVDVQDPYFEDVCNDCLFDKSKSLKQSTLDNYTNKLELYWGALSKLRIRAIRLPHLRQIDRDIKWGSQKTRREAISNLKQVFKYAMLEDIIDIDPSIKLRAGKYQKPEIDAFSFEEKELILKELSSKYRLFYLVMFESGARTGEVQALQWKDIRKDGTMMIERSTYKGEMISTKTHQARSVILSARLAKAFEDYTESRFAGGFIFLTSRGNPYMKETHITNAFRAACDTVKVRYRRPYYCRHSYATHSFMKDVNPSFVAKQMGDRIETVLRNYATWISGDSDRLEMAKFDGTGLEQA